MMRTSTSCDFSNFKCSPNSKTVHFQFDLIPDARSKTANRSNVKQIRPILKSRQFSNLLKLANDKMLRELEQCVEERDRILAGMAASPVDLSRMSPRARDAQTRYRDDMAEERERLDTIIEDKYDLLRQTLKEADMPAWMSDQRDTTTFTLVGHKKPKLFRRQSSLLCFMGSTKSASYGAPLAMASSCAKKLDRLRREFARRDSETRLSGSDLLSRVTQRLVVQ